MDKPNTHVSRRSDLHGAANTRQLRRQNFCSRWTSLVELSSRPSAQSRITYGLFRWQLKINRLREAWTQHSVTSDMRRLRKTFTYLLTYLHLRYGLGNGGRPQLDYLCRTWNYCYLCILIADTVESGWSVLQVMVNNNSTRQAQTSTEANLVCIGTSDPVVFQNVTGLSTSKMCLIKFDNNFSRRSDQLFQRYEPNCRRMPHLSVLNNNPLESYWIWMWMASRI